MKYLNSIGITRFWNNIKSYITSKIPTKVSELDNDLEFLTSVPNHDASKITSGTIDIARLPQGALERLAIVADETARFALTSSNVQIGDVVKQSDTGVMYMVVDESNLNNSAGYVEFTAGTATSVPWSGITDKPTNFVTTDTAQTISGAKTFSNENKFKQSITIEGHSGIYWDRKSYTAGTLPDSTVYYGFQNAYESGGSVFDRIRSYISTSGTNLSEHTKYAWNDLTKYASVSFWVSADGSDSEYKYNTARVIPATTNTTNLGTSSYQWRTVHAQNYYYNGTIWGLDQNNIWSGSNQFSKRSEPSIVSSVTDCNVAFTGLFNTIFFNTRGSSNYPTYGTFLFAGYSNDNYPDRYGQIQLLRSTDKRGDTNDGYVPDTTFKMWRVAPHYSLMDFMEAVRVINDGTYNYLAPITNNTTDLGLSTNQWNKIYSKEYYYNGTQWGLDQVNVWSDAQVISKDNDGLVINNPITEKGVAPAENRNNYIWFTEKNNTYLGRICHRVSPDGTTTLWLSALNYFSQGALSPSGTTRTTSLSLNVGADGTKSISSNADLIPTDNNLENLGTSSYQWQHLHVLNTHTDLVEPTMSNTGLVVRATDNTWENGSRIFLYSNTHPSQTYGTIYIDVDHGDGNNTKTALFLTPNSFYPAGGGTIGVNLGDSSHLWKNAWIDNGQCYYLGMHTNLKTKGVAPSTTGRNNTTIAFRDPNSNLLGKMEHNCYPSGDSMLSFSVENLYTNGALDTNGSNVTSTVNLALTPSGAKRFYPDSNSDVSLGTSLYQWSAVYANTYYYNGTQWGLDQANVWTGWNIYKNHALVIKDTRIPNTTAPESDTLKGVLDVWNDDNHYWGGLGYRWCANGNSELVICLSNWINNVQGYWEYKIGADKAGNQYFTPPHNLVDLGTSTRQWKSVYANSYYLGSTAFGNIVTHDTSEFAIASHTHGNSDITGIDASKIISGTIDISRLPQGALDRLITVANQTSRYALTGNDVSLGDTVKQLDTGELYIVTDITNLNNSNGYTIYTAGTVTRAYADEDGINIKTGYGKLTGTQTWSSTNTFTSTIICKDPSSTNTYGVGIYFRDYQNNRYGYIQPHTNNIVIGADNGNIQFNSSLVPYNNGALSIGASSYRWSGVYADSYYYGTTEWGLDKANTWTAQQKFTGDNSRGVLSIYNPAHTKGSATSTSELSIGTIFLGDSGNTGLANSLGFVSCDLANSGNKTMLSLSAVRNEASSTERANLVVQYDKSDNTNPEKIVCKGTVFPQSDSTYNLGTSANKWKTINGYEPSVLGEVLVDNAVTIDTTNWFLDGSEWNSLNTSIMSGWVYLAVSDCDADSFILFRRGSSSKQKNPTVGFHPNLANTGIYYLYGLFMVPKNTVCSILIRAGTNGVLSQKLLYPCFGNV